MKINEKKNILEPIFISRKRSHDQNLKNHFPKEFLN